MAPTVLLYALQLINARNMLRAGVLEDLRALRPDVRIVVVSPLARDPRFVEELARQDVAAEYLPVYELTPVQRKLTSLAIERFVRQHPTRATRIRWQRGENVARTPGHGLAAAAKGAMSHLPVPVRLLLQASDRLVPKAAYEPIFERHRPDVVAVGTGWQITETPWHVGARRWRIPSVAIDVNWDALESKPGIVRGPDELLVWSERMRSLAIGRFGYAPDAVHVTGAAHFDRYFRRDGVRPREEFLATLGFPPETRLVTLAAVASFNSPHDPDRLRVLYAAMERGGLGANCRLLVRLHPVDSMDRWRAFDSWPSLRIEAPFGDAPNGGSYETGESRADMHHQVETLVHTDVLVNVNSTIALESILLDTPVVMVAFDRQASHLPYLQSDARFLDYEHIHSLVETGGVRVADTPEDLITTVRTYLDDRSIDSAARRGAAETLYGSTDGQACRRIAGHLVRLAEQHRAGRPA